ncbi:MAG: CMP-N-acetlyneuraminic acid synthetase, partial [Lachnospiraceae bacterium]|nr:CMP-N-acetlyneuraminic acid synthetase [Lachnospiraceae bacterium]
MKNIAIIPARSGSKGLKDKNIREMAGKPLLAYSIEAAKKSGLYDTIHVSTDSEKYMEIAKGYGAQVPFLRSPEIALDSSDPWDA